MEVVTERSWTAVFYFWEAKLNAISLIFKKNRRFSQFQQCLFNAKP